jgi:DHA1 family multidrug resistance protein-like MFS transporter
MNKNRNIAILFFTQVVVMLGFGIVIPIMPFYVESFGASAKALGMMMAIFSIMQFLFAPLWGSLSDHYGRKPILLIGAFGNSFTLLLMGLSSQLWMLFASRALAGMLSSATLPTMMAYIADSTSERDRGGGMGVIGAAMGVGMVLGPGLGGWLAGRSLTLPFFVAAGLSSIALALIVAFLPESLALEHRSGHAGLRGPQLGAMWRALFGPLGFLFFLSFLMNFALTAFEGVFGLYALHRYNYGPEQVGIVLMLTGIISAVVQGMLTGPATRRWGEAWVIKASLLGTAIGFLLMLGATHPATVFLTVGFFVFANSMLRPATSSLISKRSVGGQGIAMGLNNAYMSLGRIVGPLWATTLFDLNLVYPYVSSAIVMLVSFLLSLSRMPRETTSYPEPAIQPVAE